MEMITYMLSLRKIHDPIMEDGTTAFVMALAKRDLHLIRVLMASDHPTEMDQTTLSLRAIAELDRGDAKCYPHLREELLTGLKRHKIAPTRRFQARGQLCEE